MFQAAKINAFYGELQVLRGVSLDVRAGEVHCLTGRNGAGKTTFLKSVMGQVQVGPESEITLGDARLSGIPAHQIPGHGVGYVPQGRRLFGELTVAQNLEIGGLTAAGSGRAEALALFPLLQERLAQRAGTLSGGEQQMAAIARALCLSPKLLLLDEPMEGLQPSMVARIREAVTGLRTRGMAILLVEQRASVIRAIADRITVLANGRVVAEAEHEKLATDPGWLDYHLGLS